MTDAWRINSLKYTPCSYQYPVICGQWFHLRYCVETREPHPWKPRGRSSSCRPHIPTGAACISTDGPLHLTMWDLWLRLTRYCSDPQGLALDRAGARCIRAWGCQAANVGENRTQVAIQAPTATEHCFLLMVTAQVSVSSPALRLLSREAHGVCVRPYSISASDESSRPRQNCNSWSSIAFLDLRSSTR